MTNLHRAAWAAFAGLLLFGAPSSVAQEAAPTPPPWQRGPMTAPIGDGLAEIEIDEDYVFLDAAGTRRFMELTENPVSGTEMATLAPIADEANWFVVFEFNETGYVSDEEKDQLDADAMIDSIRTGTEAANEERRKRGWQTMSIVGWHEEPHYDDLTNNLSWAIVGDSGGHQSINRIIKVLGRRGVMTVTLVAGPDELVSAIPLTNSLLAGYRYRAGSTYAEYVPGSDKLAEYGLTALVVGGGAAALVKSGLLARFWKPIALGLAALGAGIKRFFFGGRSAEHDPEKPIG
ncbi:MAG: DUF2167 domain-containing protein [Deltaproteobacteria bacterium]|nr:DUF2167 domain-containing protein [Deltaproteobacteria bacterium]